MKTRSLLSLGALAMFSAACAEPSDSPAHEGTPPRIVPEVMTIPHAPAVVPVLDEVTPALASPAMRVTIAGAGFDPASTRVFFGGVEGVIEEVTATRVVVRPGAGGTVGEDGATEVVVETASGRSNALPMRIGQSGDVDVIDTRPHEAVGDVLALPDGRRIFSDPGASRLHTIEPDGFVRAFEAPGLLVGPRGLALTPTGTVLVFQDGAAAVLEYDPGTGGLQVWKTPASAWIAGAYVGETLFALRHGGDVIDRIGPDGTVVPHASLAGNCPDAVDVTAADGAVWVGTWYGTVCRVDAGSGVAAELSLQGETPWAIRAMTAADGGLLAAGTLSGIGEIVFSISPDGTVAQASAPFDDANVAVEAVPGGWMVGNLGGAVLESTADGLRLRAAPVVGIADLREIDGRRYASGGTTGVPAFLAEVGVDGRYRVIGNGELAGTWLSITAEGANFLVASYEEGRILRIDGETGAVSVLVDHSAIGPVSAFVRDTQGRTLVASWQASNSIALYAADGTLANAGFVTGVEDTPFAMATLGDTLYLTTGTDVLTASLSQGGAASSVRPGSEGPQVYGLLGIAVDSQNGRVYVTDGFDTGAIFRLDAQGGLETVGYGTAAIGVAVAEDGAILVADLGEMPYRMLP